MLLQHFKLREEPFGVTPDPRFWLASRTHREALASLLYGLEAGRGFVALIAKPGMGKTTLLFRSLERMEKSAKIVFLFQTIVTPEDLLHAILADLDVSYTGGNIIQLQSKLNDICAEYSRSGRRIVLVIDEAQNLNAAVLEFVRMLSNFETPRRKLLEIVLSGQPQLGATLCSPAMLQLRQRISVVAHLKPFGLEGTTTYIEHRLRVSGYTSSQPLFTQPALALIAQHSEGIPRNINNLCFSAMSIACALERESIQEEIIREVISDLLLEPPVNDPFEPVLAPADETLVVSPLSSSFDRRRSARRGDSWTWAARVVGVGMILFICAALPTSNLVPKPAQRVALTVRKDDKASVVYVKPGQSFWKICVENFGDCSPTIIREVKKLNPQLQDLNHIETGEKIYVPDMKSLTRHPDTLIAKARSDSPTMETRDE